MGSRPFLLSALLFLGLAVLTGILLRMRDDPDPGPFFAMAREMPDTVMVVVPPDSTVLVQGGPAGWRVIHPVEDDADGIVVEAMLKRLRNFEVVRRFPFEPDKVDTYGMRLYRGWIRTAWKGAPEADTLTIGAFTMNATYDYVRSGTRDEIGLADARETRAYFLKSTRELRQIQLLRFHETRAVAFRLFDAGRGDPRVEAARGEDGSWKILEPWPGPGDRRRILNYLASLNHMEILGFLDVDPPSLAEAGLVPPAASAEVDLANGSTLRLELGTPAPGRTEELFARTLDRPQMVTVSDKYLPTLLYDANRLRDPVIIPFGLGDADSVAWGRGMRARGWNRDHYRGPETRDRPLRGILEAFVRLRAEDFSPAAPDTLARYGLAGSPEALQWFGPGGELLMRLEVGRVTGGRLPLRGAAGAYARPGEVFHVDPRRAEPLVEALRTGEL